MQMRLIEQCNHAVIAGVRDLPLISQLFLAIASVSAACAQANQMRNAAQVRRRLSLGDVEFQTV